MKGKGYLDSRLSHVHLDPTVQYSSSEAFSLFLHPICSVLIFTHSQHQLAHLLLLEWHLVAIKEMEYQHVSAHAS